MVKIVNCVIFGGGGFFCVCVLCLGEGDSFFSRPDTYAGSYTERYRKTCAVFTERLELPS